jgi:hypothetical protein
MGTYDRQLSIKPEAHEHIALSIESESDMLLSRRARLWALSVALALHLVLGLWLTRPNWFSQPDPVLKHEVQVTLLPLRPSSPAKAQLTPSPADAGPAQAKSASAVGEAPPPPSAEEWAFAATYTLKNSKGYRHNWGRQVRSMMGTAVEGPDQGMVRFRIEIAPNGTLARLDTLWITSPLAEQKAREAVALMPPLPPTPTGKPLVFERTIVFSPFASDDTPLYRHDCDPEIPAFRNPFVWHGQSAKRDEDHLPPPQPMSPEKHEACLKQLPPETVQSESARDQRVMQRWGTTHRGKETRN